MNTFGKWLFALLLLANVGLALWATGFREQAAVRNGGPQPALDADKVRRLDARGPCYRLGPFTEPAAAEQAGARLRAQSLAYERRTEEGQLASGYRVYLPPLASREAAENKRRELSRLGFKDSAVIQEKGLQNAVSLGRFTVEANARKRLQALAAKGVKAELQTLSQTQTLQWYYLAPAEGLVAALPRLRENDWGGAGVEIETVSCPDSP